MIFLGRGIRRRTVHTLVGTCVQKSENITLYNYIPLSQVKNKNIVLVIFVISQKQQQLFLINIVSLTYKFIFAKSQMCHPFYIIPKLPYINVLNYIRSEDEQSILWLDLVCRSPKI